MTKRLVEIDPNLRCYKKFDVNIARFKAQAFEKSCLDNLDNIHVVSEYEYRRELIDAVCKGSITNFLEKRLGQTMEEREGLLPEEVSDSWASFKLMLRNRLPYLEDKYIEKDGHWYIFEESLN